MYLLPLLIDYCIPANVGYISLSSSHETFTKIDYILGRTLTLTNSKQQKYRVYSAPQWNSTRNQNRKIAGKPPNSRKLNNIIDT